MLNLNVQINKNTYLKDPISTDLGKRILSSSIMLIDECGFENFNFKKLAREVSSTESSVYRYFENKHTLLLYLINWFWELTSMRLDLAMLNVTDPLVKINNIIKTIIGASSKNIDIPFIDEEVLHRIIVREGTKAYHHKSVDDDNSEGFFLAYKSLSEKICNVFLEVNPAYRFPNSLASTLIEVCNNNIYFAKHLPRLTDITYCDDRNQMEAELFEMLHSLVLSSLKTN
jgi:AcrR family transcriptional regulator